MRAPVYLSAGLAKINARLAEMPPLLPYDGTYRLYWRKTRPRIAMFIGRASIRRRYSGEDGFSAVAYNARRHAGQAIGRCSNFGIDGRLTGD